MGSQYGPYHVASLSDGHPFARSIPDSSTRHLLNPVVDPKVSEPRPARPQLRIVTFLPLHAHTAHPYIHRPVRVRHPALGNNCCKTAPLAMPSHSPSHLHGGHIRKLSLHREAFVIPIYEPQHTAILVGGDIIASPKATIQDAKKGHTRRLSDRLKHLLLGVRRRSSEAELDKDTKAPEDRMDEDAIRCQTIQSDQTVSPKLTIDLRLPPSRPHRSPGTASFLVSRPALDSRDTERSTISSGYTGPSTSTHISPSTLSAVETKMARRTWIGPAGRPGYLNEPKSDDHGRQQGTPLTSRFSDPTTFNSSGATPQSEEPSAASQSSSCIYGQLEMGSNRKGGDRAQRSGEGSMLNHAEAKTARKSAVRRARSLPTLLRAHGYAG